MAIHEIDTDSKWKILSSSFILGPLAAVRELIDNSVDGEAKNIFVSIDAKTGGCDYISVRDDGNGIDPADREKMCLNHTTSKITSINDLSTVTTLGFRGEALFLLANLACEVGRMEIKTKCPDEKLGEKWFVSRDGSIKEQTRKKAPNPTGTTVTIWNLLGGLKSRYIDNSKRARKIIDELKLLLSHYVLNFNNIRFNLELVSLNKNGSVASSQLQHSISSGLTKVRTFSLINKLRKPPSVNFITFDDLEITDKIKLELILPTMSPESDVVNIKQKVKFLSVNSRAISKILAFGKAFDKMVNSVYKELLLLEPNIWYMNINCETQLIDVNIEPEKNDILFYDEENTLDKFKDILQMFLREKLNIDPPNESVVTGPSLHEMRLGSQQAEETISEPKIISIIEDNEPSHNESSNQQDKHIYPTQEPHDIRNTNFEDQMDETLFSAGTEKELVQLSEDEEETQGHLKAEGLSQELHLDDPFIDDMKDYETTQETNTQGGTQEKDIEGGIQENNTRDIFIQNSTKNTNMIHTPIEERKQNATQESQESTLSANDRNNHVTLEEPQRIIMNSSQLKRRNTRRTITMFSEYTNKLATRRHITHPFVMEEPEQLEIDVWSLSKANMPSLSVIPTPEGWRKLAKT